MEFGTDRSGGPDACWPWLDATDHQGYGRIYVGYDQVLAHRAALEVKLGRRLGPTEKTRHSCDFPPCCNPDHLSPGTTAENNADCVARGRTAAGERSGSARLTAAEVLDIRRACATGTCYALFRKLAAKYGVSARQIDYIAKGQKWRSVAA